MAAKRAVHLGGSTAFKHEAKIFRAALRTNYYTHAQYLERLTKSPPPAAQILSPQLRVFRLGLLQDGNVGVGVLPQRKKIIVGGAGLGDVPLQDIGAG